MKSISRIDNWACMQQIIDISLAFLVLATQILHNPSSQANAPNCNARNRDPTNLASKSLISTRGNVFWARTYQEKGRDDDAQMGAWGRWDGGRRSRWFRKSHMQLSDLKMKARDWEEGKDEGEKFQLQWKRRGEDRLLWAGFSLKWEVLGHLHANPDLKAICHKRSFCWKWAKWIQNWVSWAQTTWVKIQKSNAVTCSTQCTHNARKSENTHTRPKVPKLPRKS